MNLAPTFISAETQTERNENLLKSDNRGMIYRIMNSIHDEPPAFNQYKEQVMRQSRGVRGETSNHRLSCGANDVRFWTDSRYPRNSETIPMNNYSESVRIREPPTYERNQRLVTQVKQINDSNMMTSYPGPPDTSIHAAPIQHVYNRFNGQNTSGIVYGRCVNAAPDHHFSLQQGTHLMTTGTSGVPGDNVPQLRVPQVVPDQERQQEILNTAILEPRWSSRDSRLEADERDWRDRRTPNTNISENFLEQQMNLMRDMFQMVSVQNAHMRDQINTRNKLRVLPEKFAGSSSFHSFKAQFEKCCEINRWEEHEKLLMLRSSLTGNAAAILWDLGADRHCTYTELVELLKARYGSEGQAESYRMQLRARRQRKGETLSSLVQDIRKLIALSYPGKASDIVESIARDAFIEALSDRELALQVLAKEPETLERAYQTATKMQSYKDLVYSGESHKGATAAYERKSSATQRETKVDDQDKGVKEEMKEMAQVIQEMSKRMAQFGEDMEKMRSVAESKNSTNKPAGKEDDFASKVKPYKKTIVCFHCNQEGHMRFQCPNKEDTNTFEPRERYQSRSFQNSHRINATEADNEGAYICPVQD